jgi:hypothetical protein
MLTELWCLGLAAVEAINEIQQQYAQILQQRRRTVTTYLAAGEQVLARATIPEAHRKDHFEFESMNIPLTNVITPQFVRKWKAAKKEEDLPVG